MAVRLRRALWILLASCLQATASFAAEAPVHELLCGGSLTVWRKARDPAARECCALVVRARAGLWAGANRSRPLAERARALCPGGLEANVSMAAVELAAGNSERAHRLFEQASTGENAPTFSLLGPEDILLAARAANLAGQPARALLHYRSVILELDRLPSPHERARVLLEAALVAAKSSPPEEAEALAYLRQSADQLAPRLAPVRLLVGHIIAPELGESRADAHELAEARELVSWMQGDGPAPRGAPGELLPVSNPGTLSELLPPAPKVDSEEP